MTHPERCVLVLLKSQLLLTRLGVALGLEVGSGRRHVADGDVVARVGGRWSRRAVDGEGRVEDWGRGEGRRRVTRVGAVEESSVGSRSGVANSARLVVTVELGRVGGDAVVERPTFILE